MVTQYLHYITWKATEKQIHFLRLVLFFSFLLEGKVANSKTKIISILNVGKTQPTNGKLPKGL